MHATVVTVQYTLFVKLLPQVKGELILVWDLWSRIQASSFLANKIIAFNSWTIPKKYTVFTSFPIINCYFWYTLSSLHKSDSFKAKFWFILIFVVIFAAFYGLRGQTSLKLKCYRLKKQRTQRWLACQKDYWRIVETTLRMGTRMSASADRTARRQFQATGQPVSRTQASDAMTSRLPRYEGKCVQRRCVQCGSVPLRSGIKGTDLPLPMYWYHSKGKWLRYNFAPDSF